ncbi:hypothetical protein [Photobacterium sanguinicancri]|uniref:Uncharacterized protein n=1 Tax=Photobacterium sanguinicancri TaxID=875932 RepID=A0ABX4FW61_9GAMM|nr:hypothetical protein [Photobacterium sanguinicancri]OZS43039.1 hypothetical protein ASV53_15385 [Photobacterium sanguinicancri]
MLVGLTKKKKEHPSEYYKLTDLQKAFYEVCEAQYDVLLEHIKATKKPLPVRKRQINKSEVCRLVKQKLEWESDLNHSHMSNQNCPFLFESIQKWNDKLQRAHNLSKAKANSDARAVTKEDLEHQLQTYKSNQVDLGREFLDYIKDSCLLDGEIELRSKVDKLTRQVNRLTKERVHLKDQNDSIIGQLADRAKDQAKLKQLKLKVIKLQNLLSENGIDFSHLE